MSKEIVRLVKESAIMVSKRRLINKLEILLDESERVEFRTLVKRVEHVIRAWYLIDFDIMMDSYIPFDPVGGAKKIKEANLTNDEIDQLEQEFLKHLFKMMRKSYFSIVTDEEFEVAQSGSYLLDLPITVDESKIDNTLFSKYFEQHCVENLPEFSDKFIIFRRGVGTDKTTDFFYMAKLDLIITRLWSWFLKKTRLEEILPIKSAPKLDNNVKKFEQKPNVQYFSVERIRLESTITSFSDLLRKVEIQEPTFKRMIVVYRKASTGEQKDRGIYVKHFKDIPMADMELVLPEKKNPSLTPNDWVKFLVSVLVGLVALFTSMETPHNDLWVAIAILSALYGYCAKIYFSFKENMETYRNLMTQSMYDKQLDSGKGTLLHLCDDVIQQEVKEVILSYFVLMKKGEATKEELDRRCEDFIKEELNKQCDFDVDDAVDKLDKLGIVARDSMEKLYCMPLREANEIIGPTADELVRKRKGS